MESLQVFSVILCSYMISAPHTRLVLKQNLVCRHNKVATRLAVQVNSLDDSSLHILRNDTFCSNFFVMLEL